MKLKVHAKKYLETLNKIWSTTGDKRMSITVDQKGIVWASGSGNDNLVKLSIPDVTVSDQGKSKSFAFDYEMMKHAVTGRSDLEIAYEKKDSRVYFKATGKGAKYSGNISTLPAEEVPDIEFDRKKALKMGEKARKIIAKAIPEVGIKNVFQNEDLLLHFKMGKKGVTVACFDQWHMALYETGKSAGSEEAEFSIPSSAFSRINGMSDGEYMLLVESNRIIAYNDEFLLSMPLIQDSESPPLSAAIQIAHGIPSKPDAAFTTNKEEFFTALSNLYSVMEDNAPGVISYKSPKEIEVSMSTNYGAVEGAVKSKAKWKKEKDKFNISVDLLLDLLGAVKAQDIAIGIVKDQSLFIRNVSEEHTSFYACNLI